MAIDGAGGHAGAAGDGGDRGGAVAAAGDESVRGMTMRSRVCARLASVRAVDR